MTPSLTKLDPNRFARPATLAQKRAATILRKGYPVNVPARGGKMFNLLPVNRIERRLKAKYLAKQVNSTMAEILPIVEGYFPPVNLSTPQTRLAAFVKRFRNG